MPREVSHEINHVTVLARSGVNGGIPDGHFVTTLPLECPHNDRRPAGPAARLYKMIDELHHVIG